MSRLWDQTPRVLIITGNQPDICSMWRVWWPCMEMTARGYVADWVKYQDLPTVMSLVKYGRYNVIVSQRMVFDAKEHEDGWHEIIDPLRDKLTWWYDVDDDLISPEFVDRQIETTLALDPSRDYGELIEQCERQRLSRLRLIEQVDGVTVGSDQLVSVVGQLTEGKIVKVPNGINARFFNENVKDYERQVKPLTIGWSGGPRLDRDMEPLFEVWAEVAKLRPDVHFVLQGWASNKLAESVPSHRLHVIGGVEIEHYPAVLTNIDIFCCIGTDDPFVLAKTPIKFYEATLAGSACVVSDSLYGDAVNGTALVAHSPKEWVDHLLSLIDNTALRKKLHFSARNLVLSTNTTEQMYKDWLDAWASTL